MQFTPITTKTESLYFSCSPELDVVSYGACREEAINNLTDEIRLQEEAAVAVGQGGDRARRRRA